jgi:AcrR family transcriptional regulator
MPELKPRRSEDPTRARILAAAAELFARHGYAAASVRDIARDVGVTVGTIYVHFAAKDRLLVAVYAEGVEQISGRVDAAVAGERGPWQRLQAAVAAHLEVLLSAAAFARVIARVLPGDVPEAARDLRRLRDGYEQRFRALVGALELEREADPRLLRLMLLGALNQAPTWYRGGAGADARAIAQQFVAILRRGAARSQGSA